MTCPTCEARITDDTQIDPETGERYPIWECPACGGRLPERADSTR